MSVKLAKLLKDARSNAGISQAELARQVDGLTAADVGKAERNEKEPTAEQLKAIAKVLGVTQKSLLEAASKATQTAAAKKPATSTAKKPASSAAKKPASSSAKTPANATNTMKLTTAEKRLIELYRKADTDTKKQVVKLLKGESSEAGELLQSLLGGALGNFLKKDSKGMPIEDGEYSEAEELIEVEIADPEAEEVSL